ncbi:hypothetical protein BJL90_12140 [Clostridium formicaceticum]|uniref:Uncharacterized protein n=3 Tax=Clostridium formicaceticum TaxID=1497 RepID=A0ABM6EU58_9CLOT|nr:hypothetical protein [Clostridium formicaceticum]AOY76543.1 hypothetical protein BJL90_12140 [Clostridium formicaceticum]
MSTDKLCDEVMNYMEDFQMLQIEENSNTVLLMPLVGKMIGDYPKDFLEKISQEKEEAYGK